MSRGTPHRRRLSWLFLFLICISCTKSEPPTRTTLTILLPEDILTLDPNREFETITDSVLFNVYEPLVGLDQNLHLQPVLAESWENPSPEEWRFHLRKGVRFHDATPFNANSVRDALVDVRESSELETSTFLTSVEQIKVLDENTISIITPKPIAILSKLPFIYITKRNQTKRFPALVGTGPYQLHQWTPGKSIRLVRSEQYWGSAPWFIDIRFIPVLDIAERFSLMKKLQADMMYGVPTELARQKNPGVKIAERPGLTVYYLGFNLDEDHPKPFHDIRVRRAIHRALDRKQIVRIGLLGFGTVATQPIAPFVFGYDPALPEILQDLGEARKLMSEAELADGFQTRLDFSHPRLRAARLVQDQLSKLNIKVTLNPLQKNSFYDLLENSRSEFFLAGWDCTSGDASEFYEFCLHSRTRGLGIGNFTHYYNPEMDNIVETNTSIRSELKRREMLQRAADITMRDLPVVPLYLEDDIYALRDDLFFEPRADSEIKVKDVYPLIQSKRR